MVEPSSSKNTFLQSVNVCSFKIQMNRPRLVSVFHRFSVSFALFDLQADKGGRCVTIDCNVIDA